jgi:hypothetical protein
MTAFTSTSYQMSFVVALIRLLGNRLTLMALLTSSRLRLWDSRELLSSLL